MYGLSNHTPTFTFVATAAAPSFLTMTSAV